MKEIRTWNINGIRAREIPELPGYFVGEDGSLWSKWSRKSLGQGKGSKRVRINHFKSIRPGKHGKGTKYFGLSRNGKRFKVHHLVLRLFKGPRPIPKGECKRYEGAHLDGNSLNNHVDNLEWKTTKDNHADKRKHGTMPIGEKVALSKLTDKQATEIGRRYDSGESASSIAKDFTIVHEDVVASICYGKSWKHIPRKNINSSHSFRTLKGEGHPKTTLTESDVLRMRRLRTSAQCTHRELSILFNISKSSVTDILKGRTWKHV